MKNVDVNEGVVEQKPMMQRMMRWMRMMSSQGEEVYGDDREEEEGLMKQWDDWEEMEQE